MRASRACTWAALAALAVPAPAVAGWSAPAVVPGSVGAGFPFDVAVGPDGAAAVAFIRDGVRVAVRDARGRWQPARRVSVADAALTSPDVELSAGGEVIVAWTQSLRRAAPLTGPNRIEVALRSRSGRWSAPQAVGSSQHFIAADPRVAVNARGDAVVLWRGARGRGEDVLRAALRPGGGRFGRGLSLREPGIDQRVLVEPSGRVDAIWAHTPPPEHLHSAIRFASATVDQGWSPARTIHTDEDGGPVFGRAPDGSFVTAWRSGGSGLDPTSGGQVLVGFGNQDAVFGPARMLSDVPAADVHLGVSATGEAVVAWSPPLDEVSAGSQPVIYWAARAPGGEFSPVNAALGVRADAFGVLADGTAIAVGGGRGVASMLRPPGGAFGAAQRIARAGDFPALATAGQAAAAVWLARGRLEVSALRP